MTTGTTTRMTTQFTAEERRALRRLRNRYRKEQTSCSPVSQWPGREQAQLGFLRFLTETGRLVP